MAIKKKYIIAGIISLVSLTAATVFYVEYTRLMNYIITFKTIVIKTISSNLINLDLFLNFENKSDVPFDITSQSYIISINGKKSAKIGNSNIIHIKKGPNTIPLAIAFNPTKILSDIGGPQALASFILNPDDLKIKIDIQLNLKLYFIPISIPYAYETTVKDLLAKKK